MDIKEFILAKCLKGQSDIEIITEKDYIRCRRRTSSCWYSSQ